MAPPSIEALIKKTKIYQVTNPRMVQAPPETTIRRAIQIMQEKSAGYLVISEGSRVIGMFTATDVARRVLGKDIDWNRPVREVMTAAPLTLTYNDTVERAMAVMAEHRFDHIPLVDADTGELAGILSVRSLIRFLAESYPVEVLNLPPDPNQVMTTPEGG